MWTCLSEHRGSNFGKGLDICALMPGIRGGHKVGTWYSGRKKKRVGTWHSGGGGNKRLAFDFCISITARVDNKHMRSCLASRRSVSGWGLATHGAMALQPTRFRFHFIPRKVPGLSANPIGFRGGGGAAVQMRETPATTATAAAVAAGW